MARHDLAAIVHLLTVSGYTPRTSVHTYRGAREVGFYGRHGVASLHGVVRVGARSGRVTGGWLRPGGEDGPRLALLDADDAHTKLCAAIIRAATPAAYRRDPDPDARPAPEPGTLVRYHGSQSLHHGVWRVREVVKYGPYAGRTVLVDPDNPRSLLTVSTGNRTITPLVE